MKTDARCSSFARVRRVCCTAAAMLVASASCVRAGSAQASALAGSASIQGTVVANEDGVALPYAIVSIASINEETFANDRGRFIFTRLAAGTYHVRVRQLGYT